MHRWWREAFERSAKAANGRSRLLLYPGVVIGVAAAAATCFSTWKNNNYNYLIKYQAIKNDQDEEEERKIQLEVFKKQELNKLYEAVFKPLYYDDDGVPVFPAANGRTINQMVHDYEEEEEKKNPNKYQKFSQSARCDFARQLLMSDCGATEVNNTEVNKTAVNNTAVEENLDEIRLEIEAKLRGMSTAEFLVYAKEEKAYCREMCAKCKQVPLPPGCDQETVDKYCGK